MTKEEFKELFKECFELRVDVTWTDSKFPDYVLKVSIVDADTHETVMRDWVPTYQIKE
ncbi:MAG: hypothetical protein [Caudoviricetes sp.]|nr:MAG: hypothetical protein [Caudoviricetes sp.]